MHDRSILLVEDNPDDEALTRRALAKNNIQNEIILARDGAEALDWLFGTGAHAGRPPAPAPRRRRRPGTRRARLARDAVAPERHVRRDGGWDPRRRPRGSHRQLQPQIRRAVAHSRLDPRNQGRPPNDSLRAGAAGGSPGIPEQSARSERAPRRLELRRADLQARKSV